MDESQSENLQPPEGPEISRAQEAGQKEAELREAWARRLAEQPSLATLRSLAGLH